MSERKLVVNMMRCPDGTFLVSRHRHDFVQYKDADGNYFSLDGGIDYQHLSGNMENCSIYSDSLHALKREYFVWGNYGKDGRQPLKHILLKDLETDHITAIISTQTHLQPHIYDMFIDELKLRLEM